MLKHCLKYSNTPIKWHSAGGFAFWFWFCLSPLVFWNSASRCTCSCECVPLRYLGHCGCRQRAAMRSVPPPRGKILANFFKTQLLCQYLEVMGRSWDLEHLGWRPAPPRMKVTCFLFLHYVEASSIFFFPFKMKVLGAPGWLGG